MEKLRVLLWTAPLTLGEFISCSFESRKRFEFTTVVQQGAAKANTSDSRMTKVSRLLKTAWVKHLLQFYCVLCVLCVLLSIEKQNLLDRNWNKLLLCCSWIKLISSLWTADNKSVFISKLINDSVVQQKENNMKSHNYPYFPVWFSIFI